MYFGNSSNQPQSISIDLSNYVTRPEIATNLKYMFGAYSGTETLTGFNLNYINLGFEPKLLHLMKRKATATQDYPMMALVLNLHYWSNLERPYDNIIAWVLNSNTESYLVKNNISPSFKFDSTGFYYGRQFDEDTDYMYMIFY